MSETVKYGILGTGELQRDDNGFFDVLVVVRESGLYGGRPPAEIRIAEVFSPQEKEDVEKAVAEMNKKTDLPYYIHEAKIKVGKMIELGE